MVFHPASNSPTARNLSAGIGRPVGRTRNTAASKHGMTREAAPAGVFVYDARQGVEAYVAAVRQATPMQWVEFERLGVQGEFIKDLARRMGMASSRMFAILGVPKATAEKRAASGERVDGGSGQAAVGLIRLLTTAQDIVADSTAEEAQAFDVPLWLGQWLETPQPALGGLSPAELIDTPTGRTVVQRVLGALVSGSYQ